MSYESSSEHLFNDIVFAEFSSVYFASYFHLFVCCEE